MATKKADTFERPGSSPSHLSPLLMCRTVTDNDDDHIEKWSTEIQMSELNRLQSGMHYCNDELVMTETRANRRRRELEEKQNHTSPFLIGSMQKVNDKISQLDRKLQSFTKLVYEDYEKELEDEAELADLRLKAAEKRAKETKEINQFAGLYTIKSTLMPSHSERTKNISKISSQSSTYVVQTESSGKIKPKFAEMYQFPGYNKDEPTPLPRDIAVKHFLRKVAIASMNLDRKRLMKTEFETLLYSVPSQEILQDAFWYVFLFKYQQNEYVMQQLFSRIAHNYVQLLLVVRGDNLAHAAFIREYPILLAQGVYAIFCECFPDSFRQYDQTFKDYICNLTCLWMTGTKASNKCWANWNFKLLEPVNLRQTEELTAVTESDDKSSVTVMEVIRNLGQSPGLNPPAASSHVSTVNSSRNISRESPVHSPSTVSSNQKFRNKLKSGQSPPSQYPSVKFSKDLETIKERISLPRRSKASKSLRIPLRQRTQSYPLPGQGPDYVKCAFDLFGRSPLLDHVLRKHTTQDRNKCVQCVLRTELDNLPSSEAVTYQDLIRETLHNCKRRERRYVSMLTRVHHNIGKIWSDHNKFVKDSRKQEATILSKQSNMKKFVNELILEQMNAKQRELENS